MTVGIRKGRRVSCS
uniref:Uncharacterized protein n=1 Tax=Rhizophora mucronata TaxID=61149 RepID=A0A2P2PH99_RHIMU